MVARAGRYRWRGRATAIATTHATNMATHAAGSRCGGDEGSNGGPMALRACSNLNGDRVNDDECTCGWGPGQPLDNIKEGSGRLATKRD